MNLIKMNLYRMIKMRSFYVTLIILALFTTIIVADTVSRSTYSNLEQQLIEENSGDEQMIGMTVNSVNVSDADVMVKEFLSSGILLCMFGIFVALFCHNERASGYQKNLVNCCTSKKMIFLSKIPCISLFMFLQLAIVTIISFIWLPIDNIDFVKFAVRQTWS